MAHLQVRQLAEAQHLNLSQLYRLILKRFPDSHIAYTTLFHLWHNTTTRPDLRNLAVVARVLGVPTGGLIVDDPEGVTLEEPPKRRQAREARKARRSTESQL